LHLPGTTESGSVADPTATTADVIDRQSSPSSAEPVQPFTWLRPFTWARIQSALWAWAYVAEDGRDLRIDLLRGLAVLAMVIDHIAGPSRLYLITGGNRFYTSAAEAFIFLSGLTVGLVYRRVAERQGFAVAARRLLARAWLLYVLAVALTLVILPVSEVLSLPWASGVEATSPAQLVWAILSLHQTYYLVDVLALYVLLMLAAPLALLVLWDGRTWLVLGLSWLIWVGFQLFPRQTELPWTTAGNNLFYLSAWQPLFFTAMVVGYHRDRVARVVSRAWQLPLFMLSGLAFAGLILVYLSQTTTLQAILALAPGASPWTVADLEDVLFAKGYVRPGRVVASVVVFGFLFQLVTLAWAPIRRGLGWLLVPLGQNALYAYSSHVLLALLLGFLGTQVSFVANPWLNAVIQVTSIGLIWLAIRFRVAYPTPETRTMWMSAVLPLIIAAGVLIKLDAAPMPVALADQVAESVPNAEAIRQARAFGTPVPRIAGTNPDLRAAPAARASAVSPEAVAVAPPAVPAPASAPPMSAANLAGSASQYVGPIEGTFREVSLYSPSLDRDMSYYVYLPPGYGSEGRRYPVLYMLHGAGGSKDEWPAYGLVDDVDRSIVSKDIRPLIVVMPQGDLGYWVNWADAGPRWGDYVARDLRRHIDATFRTLPDPAHRAIGGLSMGGAGALQLAFNHPDIFQVAGSHSPSLHLDDGTFGSIYGTDQDFMEREPIDLARNAPGIKSLKIWVDAGEGDPWLERDQVLHENLLERGIVHNWSVLTGGHDGSYWIQNLPAYLRFYDGVLNGESGS
jgi:S-formylglutathione hydrolase FrmB